MPALNEAAALYVGSQAVDAAYLGGVQVWSSGPPSTRVHPATVGRTGTTWSPTAASVAWTPLSISGLVTWLDASQLGLANDAAVSPWPNLASGPTPTIVGTPAPVCKTNVVGSKSVVRFMTNEGRLRSTWADAVHDWTLLYVMRWIGPTAGRAFSVQYPPSNLLIGVHSAGKDLAYDNGEWRYGPDNTWANWTPLPGPWRLYGADSETGQGLAFFINGAQISTRTSGVGGLTNGWGLSGYDAAGTQETMEIEVAELLLYNRRLASTTERVVAENYLTTKWGVV